MRLFIESRLIKLYKERHSLRIPNPLFLGFDTDIVYLGYAFIPSLISLIVSGIVISHNLRLISHAVNL